MIDRRTLIAGTGALAATAAITAPARAESGGSPIVRREMVEGDGRSPQPADSSGDFVHPDDLEPPIAAIRGSAADMSIFREELRRVSASGIVRAGSSSPA